MSHMLEKLSVLASTSEHQLLVVVVQLMVIIIAARVSAIVAKKLKQPAVVGEVIAGLILGPSLFGHFFPDISACIFDTSVSQVFDILKELGLIFLLFIIGLEFDFAHLKTHGRSALSISLMGLIIPFGLGYLIAGWVYPQLETHVDEHGFALFMGTAMAITAIPVLGRIMMELNITRTRLGTVTITAAAFDDAAGWILLASVSAVVRANFEATMTVRMIAEVLAFLAAMIFAVRPVFKRWIAWVMPEGSKDMSLNALAVLIVCVFVCSIATSLIGIFAIFGAFVLGAVLSDQHNFREAVYARLQNFVTAFFLPIFFTYTGLRTDVSSLHATNLWLATFLICAAAIVGKFGGCSIAALFSGYSWRESACIGALMNTRGLMELIVINTGYNLGVIPRSVFCILVIMAVVTTVMTTPLVLFLMRGTELESHIATSGFTKLRHAPDPLKLNAH